MMQESDFVQLLTECTHLASPPDELAYLPPESGSYIEIENHWVEIDLQVLDLLVGALHVLPTYTSFRNLWVARNPEMILGAPVLTDYQLARWLLAQTRLRGAEEAYRAFVRFLERNEVHLRGYVALWGVRPAAAFELAPGITLIPIEDLPSSSLRDRLLGLPESFPLGARHLRHELQFQLSAALAFEVPHHRVFVPPSNFMKPHDTRAKASSRPPETARFLAQVREIVRLLPLIVERSVQEVCSWYEADVSLPLVGGSQEYRGFLFDHAVFTNEVAGGPNIDPTPVRAIVDAYLRLSEVDRRKLHLALERVNLAMRETDLRDRAINIGIALESLLIKPDEKTELTFRIKVRGARLLDGSTERKRETYRLIGELYTLRSQAVHGSEIVFKKGYSSEFLKQGEALIREILRIIINNGVFPDLDALVLGD